MTVWLCVCVCVYIYVCVYHCDLNTPTPSVTLHTAVLTVVLHPWLVQLCYSFTTSAPETSFESDVLRCSLLTLLINYS